MTPQSSPTTTNGYSCSVETAAADGKPESDELNCQSVLPVSSANAMKCPSRSPRKIVSLEITGVAVKAPPSNRRFHRSERGSCRTTVDRPAPLGVPRNIGHASGPAAFSTASSGPNERRAVAISDLKNLFIV